MIKEYTIPELVARIQELVGHIELNLNEELTDEKDNIDNYKSELIFDNWMCED